MTVEKKEAWWVGIRCFICIVIVLILIILFRINENVKVKDTSVRDMVQNTDFRKLSEIENEYTLVMYDVLRPVTRGGFSDYGYRKCMNDREKIAYTAKNFKLARSFNFNLYGVPTEHILESNFNPYKIHEGFKELGLGGFWYGTAIMYHLYAERYMPSHLWRLVKFNLRSSADLLIWENALSMSYIWKWVESKSFNGLEMWLESSRRWGRFIYKHYNEGNNMFPVSFSITWSSGEVRNYNPRMIHYTWKTMIMYFGDGNIIAAHGLYKEFKKETVKLEKEEMHYRNLKQQNKQLKKKINNYEKIELIRNEELKLLKQQINRTDKILKQIAGEAKEKGWPPEVWKKFRDKIKGFIK